MGRTAGQQMEVISDFRTVGRRGRDDRMPRVVSSRTATAKIAFGGEDINELAFAFVAPLGSEDDHAPVVHRRQCMRDDADIVEPVIKQ